MAPDLLIPLAPHPPIPLLQLVVLSQGHPVQVAQQEGAGSVSALAVAAGGVVVPPPAARPDVVGRRRGER